MDWINGFLNLTAPPFTLFALFHFFPQWHHIKYWLAILGSVFSENVAGKVVLITGASNVIGELTRTAQRRWKQLKKQSKRLLDPAPTEESAVVLEPYTKEESLKPHHHLQMCPDQHLAYEYASRGACLALAAMGENRLREVVDRCLQIGSLEVITQHVDIANVNDCRHFIDQVVNHFGRLDHLVNNAGISHVSMLEEIDDIAIMRPVMDINFWGSVYITRFAAPHLRNTSGRIIVVSSPAASLPQPGMSLYNASQAAKVQFFETLRVEFGSDIKITIATPGLLESELTQVKFPPGGGEMEVDADMRDVQFSLFPVGKAEECARVIVNSACRGERDATEPAWIRMALLWKLFWPEVIEWTQRLILMTMNKDSAKDTLGKEI